MGALLVFVGLWALLALIPAYIAETKGRSFGGFWFYGFLIWPVAIIHAVIMKAETGSEHAESYAYVHQSKKCPFCAEIIKAEARICPHCRQNVETVALENDQRTADTFDRNKWNALIKYDDEVGLVAKKLEPLGQKWVDEFASSYLALNDKSYLPVIVQKIIAQAKADHELVASKQAEEQKIWSQLQEASKVPVTLSLPEGRAEERTGPFEYRGRYFFRNNDGSIEGQMRGGWVRFPSVRAFQERAALELDIFGN